MRTTERPVYLQVGGVLPVWQGVHWAWAQLTPHGFAVVFMVLWQVKQIGVVPLVLLSAWFPEVMPLPKHSELCCTSRSRRGFVHDGVATVPAWHLRHEALANA